MSQEVMKKCCGLCPFSRKSTLYVHPDRAYDFALSTQNPYNDFVCHKTGETDEAEGDILRGDKSLTCAGFHVMQNIVNNTEDKCKIEIDKEDHFWDDWEMTDHHQDEWDRKHKPQK